MGVLYFCGQSGRGAIVITVLYSSKPAGFKVPVKVEQCQRFAKNRKHISPTN